MERFHKYRVILFIGILDLFLLGCNLFSGPRHYDPTPYRSQPMGQLQAGVNYDPKRAYFGPYIYDIYNVPSDGDCWGWSAIALIFSQILESEKTYEDFLARLDELKPHLLFSVVSVINPTLLNYYNQGLTSSYYDTWLNYFRSVLSTIPRGRPLQEQLKVLNYDGGGGRVLKFIKLASALLNTVQKREDAGKYLVNALNEGAEWGELADLGVFFQWFGLSGVSIIDMHSNKNYANSKIIANRTILSTDIQYLGGDQLDFTLLPEPATRVMLLFVNKNHYRYIVRRPQQ